MAASPAVAAPAVGGSFVATSAQMQSSPWQPLQRLPLQRLGAASLLRRRRCSPLHGSLSSGCRSSGWGQLRCYVGADAVLSMAASPAVAAPAVGGSFVATSA